MNKSFLTYAWKAINSPIVVVVLALTIWPILTTLTASFAVSNIKKAIVGATEDIVDAVTEPFMQMGEDSKAKQIKKLNVFNLIEIKNIKTAPSSWKTKEKVIGTIVNNSDKTLTSIKLNASFYDTEGNLIDVVYAWLSSLELLLPKQSADFSFDRDLGRHEESEEILASRKSASIEIVISNVDIVEKESKTE